VANYLNFNDPLHIIWRKGTVDDPYSDKTESLLIVNNVIVLHEIPDKFNHVVITGYTEIDDDLGRAPNSTEFVVDYQTGIITFNSSEEGKTVTTTYKGRGYIQYPAERIYFHNKVDVLQTMQEAANQLEDIIDTTGQLSDAITTGQTLKTDLDADIASGNTLKTGLDTSIATGETTKANLDASNTTANNTKTALDASNTTANNTKTALDASNSTASTTKTNLDASISTGTTLKAGLDSDISTGTTLKNDLETDISTATTKKTQLDTSITNAGTAKVNLDASITSSNTAKSNLDASVSTAITTKSDLDASNTAASTTKTNLDTSIATGNTLKTDLDSRITTGSTLKTNLDNNISTGTTLESELTTTITDAEDTKLALDGSIATGGTAKSDLDASIATGNTLKTDLDSRISTGSTLKTDLDSDIATGNTLKTDLDTRITDATSINTTLTGSIEAGQNKIQEMDAAIADATDATNAANTAATHANDVADRESVFEEYDNTKVYYPLNKVAYDGSSYVCILETTAGILPTNTLYWILIALAGSGSVSSVNGDGTGNVTVTNPNTNPVISINVGTGANQIVKLGSDAKFSADLIKDGTTNAAVTIAQRTSWNNKQDALGFTPENVANKGAVNGYAPLDSSGIIPAQYLPIKPSMHVVTNATARNALTGMVSGEMAYETSTGDTYIWDGSVWQLQADANWANVNIDWANIINKPTSTVSQIDTAVTNSHTHSNKAILDATTESFTTAYKNKIDNISFDGATNTATFNNIYLDGEIYANSGNTALFIVPVSGGEVGFTNNAKTAYGLRVVDGTNPATYTKNNTLDNGSGTMSIAGQLNFTGTTGEIGMAVGTTAGFTNNAHSGWLLRIDEATGQVKTKNNTLDNGSGQATFNGLTTFMKDVALFLPPDSKRKISYTYAASSGVNIYTTSTEFGIEKEIVNTGVSTFTPVLKYTMSSNAIQIGSNTTFDGSGKLSIGASADFNGSSYYLGVALPSGSTTGAFGIKTGGGASAVTAFLVGYNNTVSTKNNTLDDGSGNITTTAKITTSTLLVNGNTANPININANTTGNTYIDIYKSDGTTRKGYIGFGSANTDMLQFVSSLGSIQLLQASGYSVTTRNNTLDDSTGTATFMKAVVKGSGSSWVNVVAPSGNDKRIYLYNDGSILKLDAYDYTANAALDVQLGGNGGKVKTANNIIDDGTGKMTIYNQTTNATAGTSTTLTLKRLGVNGTSYDNIVEMRVGRYKSGAGLTGAYTSLQFWMNDGNTSTPEGYPFEIRSDGRISTFVNTLDYGDGRSEFSNNMTVWGDISVNTSLAKANLNVSSSNYGIAVVPTATTYSTLYIGNNDADVMFGQNVKTKAGTWANDDTTKASSLMAMNSGAISFYTRAANASAGVGTLRFNVAVGGAVTTTNNTLDDTTNSGKATFASDVSVGGSTLITSGNGKGIGFWSSIATYGIFMSASNDATWGGRLDSTSDYNMYFKMDSAGNASLNRGFVFKTDAGAVAQIDRTGTGYLSNISLKDATATRLYFNYSTNGRHYFQKNGEYLRLFAQDDSIIQEWRNSTLGSKETFINYDLTVTSKLKIQDTSTTKRYSLEYNATEDSLDIVYYAS
jgi:hypothetical protein